MNDQNSRRSQTLQEIHNNGQPQLDTTSSHDDFLGQILRSVPSSASYFPWTDDQSPSLLGYLDELSAAVLASKMKQHSITNDAAEALMLQQQIRLSRSLDVASGLRSPTGAENAGLIPVAQGDRNDVVDAPFFKSTDPANDASVKAPLNVFTGSPGQTSSPPPQQFHHPQAQNFEASAGPPMSQTAAQPRQRVRARRGQATDPHSIAERLRRARISGRMKALQELVPNANKTDKASMLDDIIDYVKFLQLQVKILSMSRLGGAAAGAVAPLAKDTSSENNHGGCQTNTMSSFQSEEAKRRSGNGTQTASSSQNNEGLTAAEQQVAKLMEDDMGSAMQYLHGKGLCLMPISLATAIS